MFYQILVASLIGGVLSLAGGLILLWREKFAKRVSLYLISFAAGSLLGAAFLDIIPESTEAIGNSTFVYVLVGIVMIFVFEKFLGWYHYHDHDHDRETFEHTFSAQTVLFGDTLHNFIDGIAIALAFFVSTEVGIATTFAVFLHEIPQEIGDFGVLIRRGYSKSKIIFYNLITALAAVVGALSTYFLLPFLPGMFMFFALAVAAGVFIYISTSDLIPELRVKSDGGFDVGHTLALLFGIIAVALI